MAKVVKPPSASNKIQSMDAMDAIMTVGDDKLMLMDLVEESESDEPPLIIRSGIDLLDRLLRGGLRGGKMTEIFGENKTGKTELSRSFAEHFLKDYSDSRVWYYDQEFALNPMILNQYPVFSDRVRFRPFVADTMEQFFGNLFKAFKKAIEMKVDRMPLLIVLDSLPALRPNIEIETDDLEKVIMMKQASLLSQAIPKLRGYLHKTGAHVIVVNQLRDKPNQQAFVEAESPGGKAVKFYADCRLVTSRTSRFTFSAGREAKKDATTGKTSKPSGFFSKVFVRKNKLGIPEREIEIPLTYMAALGQKSGLSNVWCVFYALIASKIIVSKGGKFHLGPDSFSRKEWVNMFTQSLDENDRILPSTPIGDAVVKWYELQSAADIMAVDKAESAPVEEEETE